MGKRNSNHEYTQEQINTNYYTKEDITDYISKNTIIPFLLNQIENNIQIFDLLQNNHSHNINY